MTNAPRFEYPVEPLSASHDRAAFHSGVPALDQYLHHQAGQDARRKVAAPFVLTDQNGAILGYYTLSAYSVQLAGLPEAIAKKLPRYPLLPATLLGRLAISSSCRGQHLGRFLLMDALYRSWRNTSEVASVGVVVEALDENARAFYLHHEFGPLVPFQLVSAKGDRSASPWRGVRRTAPDSARIVGTALGDHPGKLFLAMATIEKAL